MSQPAHLRARAETEAARLPPLLARAEKLAGAVLLGDHGRRRAGLGDDFWQYRPMQQGDSRRMVDWRRSARSDAQFVREREWKIAQTIQIWVDQGKSMQFSSTRELPSKVDRARLLALACAILLDRGGERVGLTGNLLPPRRGRAQLRQLAGLFDAQSPAEYSPPDASGLIPHARAIFVSDFLGPFEPVHAALTKAADRGIRGVCLQVIDPSEEDFPFHGRTIFESVGRSLYHETLKANEIRDGYLQRLAARKAELGALCALTGWQYECHHTAQSTQAALLWLWRALDGGARV